MLSAGGAGVNTRNAINKRNWHYTPSPSCPTPLTTTQSPFRSLFRPQIATLSPLWARIRRPSPSPSALTKFYGTPLPTKVAKLGEAGVPSRCAVGAIRNTCVPAEAGVPSRCAICAVRHTDVPAEAGVPSRCAICAIRNTCVPAEAGVPSRCAICAVRSACVPAEAGPVLPVGAAGRWVRLFLNEGGSLLGEAAEVAVREEQEDGRFVSAGELAHHLQERGVIVRHVGRDSR